MFYFKAGFFNIYVNDAISSIRIKPVPQITEEQAMKKMLNPIIYKVWHENLMIVLIVIGDTITITAIITATITYLNMINRSLVKLIKECLVIL